MRHKIQPLNKRTRALILRLYYGEQEDFRAIAELLGIAKITVYGNVMAFGRGLESYGEYQRLIAKKRYNQDEKHSEKRRQKKLENRELSELIRTWKMETGESLSKLVSVGVTRTAIKTYALGKYFPSDDVFLRLMSRLKMDYDALRHEYPVLASIYYSLTHYA